MPDDRTTDAIAHWAPRFIAQGVDYNDFVRTTAAVERWEQWLDAWVATGDTHAELAADAERRRRRLTAGEAYVRAALCYHFATFVWLVDLAKRKVTAERAVRTQYAALSLLDPSAQRLEIPFGHMTIAGPDAGNLRVPQRRARRTGRAGQGLPAHAGGDPAESQSPVAGGVRQAGPPDSLPAGRARRCRSAECHTGHVPGGQPRL